jgi:hypothetical protein
MAVNVEDIFSLLSLGDRELRAFQINLIYNTETTVNFKQ